jgi:hypothetical protein
MSRLLIPLNWILKFRPGRLGLKKYFPTRLYNALKVLKYYLWLLYFQAIVQRKGIIAALKILFDRRPRLLFYPDVPFETSAVYQYCLMNAYHISNNPTRPFDAVMKWRDATFYQPDSVLLSLIEQNQVINARCNNIGKKYIDGVHQEIFGYSTAVDPLTFQGKLVQKSDINALHDAKVLQGPLASFSDQYIYQILIDNRVSEEEYLDIRIPVFNGKFDFVCCWYNQAYNRFNLSGKNYLKVFNSSDALSPDEQTCILRFCQAIGFDYGELDVLRDRDSGLIYIVDANNTPDGWLDDWSAKHEADQVNYWKAASFFDEMIRNPAPPVQRNPYAPL